MKILRATFDGVAGVRDATIDFRKSGNDVHDVFAITGPPASGKTQALEAMIAAKEVVGPYGIRPLGERFARMPDQSAKVTMEWKLDPHEQKATGAGPEPISAEAIFSARRPPPVGYDAALVSVLEAYDHHPDVSKLEYFPARRRLPRSSYAYVGRPPSRDAKRRARLGDDDAKYDSTRQFLLELCLGLHEFDTEGPRGADRFGAAFEQLCSSKHFEGVTHGNSGQRLVFSDALGNTFDLDHLSDFERQAALFAATFVDLNLRSSVIFIDTPEVFVPEPMVADFVRGIAGLGPDNQLIVSTASPKLLASLGAAQVFTLGTGARA